MVGLILMAAFQVVAVPTTLRLSRECGSGSSWLPQHDLIIFHVISLHLSIRSAFEVHNLFQ